MKGNCVGKGIDDKRKIESELHWKSSWEKRKIKKDFIIAMGQVGYMAKEKKSKAEKIEREFVVGLGSVYKYPRQQRSMKALSALDRFAFKHFRAKKQNVLVSNGVNEFIWKHGREHVPRKIAVKVVFSEGKAHFFLKGEKVVLPKEEKKEAKAEKKEAKLSEEEKAAKEEKEKKKEDKKLAEKSAEMAALKRGK